MKKLKAKYNRSNMVITVFIIVCIVVGMVTYSYAMSRRNPIDGYKMSLIADSPIDLYSEPTNQLLKTYREYQQFQVNFDFTDVLDEGMFEKNDYIAYVCYDGSCTPGIMYPTSVKIDNDKIKLSMFDSGGHGVCAQTGHVYFIPIKEGELESILPIEVKFYYR